MITYFIYIYIMHNRYLLSNGPNEGVVPDQLRCVPSQVLPQPSTQSLKHSNHRSHHQSLIRFNTDYSYVEFSLTDDSNKEVYILLVV